MGQGIALRLRALINDFRVLWNAALYFARLPLTTDVLVYYLTSTIWCHFIFVLPDMPNNPQHQP